MKPIKYFDIYELADLWTEKFGEQHTKEDILQYGAQALLPLYATIPQRFTIITEDFISTEELKKEDPKKFSELPKWAQNQAEQIIQTTKTLGGSLEKISDRDCESILLHGSVNIESLPTNKKNQRKIFWSGMVKNNSIRINENDIYIMKEDIEAFEKRHKLTLKNDLIKNPLDDFFDCKFDFSTSKKTNESIKKLFAELTRLAPKGNQTIKDFNKEIGAYVLYFLLKVNTPGVSLTPSTIYGKIKAPKKE